MTASQQLKLANFIDGCMREPTSQAYLPSYEPATGQVYCLVPDSRGEDIQAAVHSAAKAFRTWSGTSRANRAALLNRIADRLEARLEEFAVAESRDQGKPVSLARAVDIPRAVLNFRYFAGRVLHMTGVKSDLDGVALNYTQFMPAGVAGLISPWNLPLYLLTWKIAPCLAAGATCVCKPSEFTSVTAWMLCSVLQEAGVPPGVVNMVFGRGQFAGQGLVEHEAVPLISFTGGTVTGQKIIQSSAKYCKKLSLELGGKNANIIFEDADWEQCLNTTLRSSFSNQGEICLCGSRIFVHVSKYEEFVRDFVERVEKMILVGDPRDPNSTMGALVSKEHLEKVKHYIALAREECGVVYGGEAVHPPSYSNPKESLQGYFLQPTVIATRPLGTLQTRMHPATSRVMQEEIFGPVVTVSPFESEQEVIEWTNGVPYGLSASIWTENGRRQRRVAEQLHVGTVWVNCWMVRDLNMPFGGMKGSGVGREGGDKSLEFFSEVKTICLAN